MWHGREMTMCVHAGRGLLRADVSQPPCAKQEWGAEESTRELTHSRKQRAVRQQVGEGLELGNCNVRDLWRRPAGQTSGPPAGTSSVCDELSASLGPGVAVGAIPEQTPSIARVQQLGTSVMSACMCFFE